MIGDTPFRWILWALVFYVAMRSLISTAILLRDRLQGLLVAHVKQQQVDAQKRKRIQELREKIRIKKANLLSAEAREREAKLAKESKAA